MKRFATILACLLLVGGVGASLSSTSQVDKANYQLSVQEDHNESLTGVSAFYDVPEVTVAASPSETPKRATASPLVEGSARDVVASIRGPTDNWSKGHS